MENKCKRAGGPGASYLDHVDFSENAGVFGTALRELAMDHTHALLFGRDAPALTGAKGTSSNVLADDGATMPGSGCGNRVGRISIAGRRCRARAQEYVKVFGVRGDRIAGLLKAAIIF